MQSPLTLPHETVCNDAADWAFQTIIEQIQARVSSGIDTFESLASSMFDEDIQSRRAVGNRIFLSSPDDEKPSMFIEKVEADWFQIVVEWSGEEMVRDNFGVEFYSWARGYTD